MLYGVSGEWSAKGVKSRKGSSEERKGDNKGVKTVDEKHDKMKMEGNSEEEEDGLAMKG